MFLLLLVILFFVLLFAGTPVAVVMGFTTGLYFFVRDIPLMVIPHRLMFVLDSFPLLSVTLFIFAGTLVNEIKITDRIFNFARAVVGRFPGGLAQVNTLSSLVFAGMSGSALADIGGVGQIEYKAMKDANYPDDFSIGITIASSVIGPIFPPSIGAVIYAVMAGESATRVLLGGVVPGIVLTIALMIACHIVAKKRNFPRDEPATLKQIIISTWYALPAILTPVILTGGMISGFFSPTEAAMITIMYVVVLGLAYKTLTWKIFWKTCASTLRTSAAVLFIFAMSMLISWVLANEQIPQSLASMLSGLLDTPSILMIAIVVIYLILGCLMDDATMGMLLTPMFIPIAKAAGINMVHFLVVIMLAGVLGLFTPPVGMGLFMGSKATGIPFKTVTKGTLPFVIALLCVLFLLIFVPQIILILPNSVLG